MSSTSGGRCSDGDQGRANPPVASRQRDIAGRLREPEAFPLGIRRRCGNRMPGRRRPPAARRWPLGCPRVRARLRHKRFLGWMVRPRCAAVAGEPPSASPGVYLRFCKSQEARSVREYARGTAASSAATRRAVLRDGERSRFVGAAIRPSPRRQREACSISLCTGTEMSESHSSRPATPVSAPSVSRLPAHRGHPAPPCRRRV